MTAATFAAVFATLYAAHHIADFWVQTDHQAATKGNPDWVGRLACARHVATYTATLTVMLVVVVWLLPLPVTVLGVIVGQVVSAGTHYWADRRTPLRRLADATRNGVFYRLGAPRPGRDDNPSLGTGAYALDQAFHVFWLFIAALCTTLI